MIVSQSLKISQVESRDAHFGASINHYFQKKFTRKLHKITSSKFADDTKITTECLYELRSDLVRLHGLASENKMVFNVDETKLICVSSKNQM